MGYIQDIAEIEDRARNLNLSVHALCRRAGVRPALWWHWKSVSGNPTVRTFSAATKKMRDALDAEEARVLASIKGSAA